MTWIVRKNKKGNNLIQRGIKYTAEPKYGLQKIKEQSLDAYEAYDLMADSDFTQTFVILNIIKLSLKIILTNYRKRNTLNIHKP
jgi:type IV secretory pathway VirB6-like protein